MASIAAKNYALPPKDYFWKWSEDGITMDWLEGKTLAFREEVWAILQSLAEQGGLPPLGSLLLVNAACADKVPEAMKALNALVSHHRQDLESTSSQKLLGTINYVLKTIASLPSELRSGTQAKAQLCHAIFSRNPWAHRDEGALLIVEELHAAPSASWFKEENPYNISQRFLRDSSAIIKAVAGLDKESLEHLIRTGIEFPDIQKSDLGEDLGNDSDDSRTLLEKLATADQESRALANIARQVIGLIALPLPATQDDELPIGGVADIVNRGSPDKLLTSELAWGDTILATRLAQNEALYYHRETPPQNAASRRLILMDHGLRYWGLLRLFALATHLGLKFHTSTNEKLQTFGFVSTAESYRELPLESPADVQAALALLPVHLRLTPALNALNTELITQEADQSVSDVFLISSALSQTDPDNERALFQLTTTVRNRGGRLFQAVIDEEGTLIFYEHRARGTRVLQQGKLDLDELFPGKEEKSTGEPPKKASTTLRSPSLEKLTGSKFYNQYPPPLWFPANALPGSGFCPSGEDEEYIGLDTRRHLMRWSEHGDQATELSEQLPGRNHWIGQTEEGDFLVACSGERAGDSARVYWVKETGHIEKILIEKTKHAFPRRAVFQGPYVIFIYSDFAEAFSIHSGKKIASRESKDHALHEQTIRVVDEEIAISLVAPKDQAPNRFFTKFQISESCPKNIHPTTVGLSEYGDLLLSTETQLYFYDSNELTWNLIKRTQQHPIPNSAVFKPTSKRRFGNEDEILTATLNDVKISYDPRGVMHITFESESWTIHTHEGRGSIWKSRDPDEVRSATKNDFLAFLKKVQHNIIPKKRS